MKVAVVQLNTQDDLEKNLLQIGDLIDTAAVVHGAELVALPEYALCLTGRRDCAIAHAQVLDNSTALAAIAHLARKHHVALHLGSVVERGTDGNLYNTSVAFGRDGTQISRYRKMNLFQTAKPEWANSVVHYEAGFLSTGTSVETFELEGMTFGNSICFDLRHAVHYQKLRAMGAEIILCPSAFTSLTGERDWQALLTTRARETGCYMVGANQCGSFDDGCYESWGHSMIVAPTGEVVVECQQEPGVISTDILERAR
ncbi:nitrilase-related carbon-nitrogen hydrolase [Sulfitobacter sp. 916]|jgi:nitrilase|uniref:nitrilase-related carbon-nitrogen hydrolase n=1 Tax=Sulfitobacter sp. 916 TaxID=3368559 RepID=UPI0037470032